MALAVYTLCTLTALLCAVRLLSAYRTTRTRLLFWSGLCFVGLTLNGLMVIADLGIFLNIDLRLARVTLSLASMTTMLFGLIWEAN